MSIELDIIDVDSQIIDNNIVFICPFCRYKGLSRRQNKNKPEVEHRHGKDSMNTLVHPHCLNINLPSHLHNMKGTYCFRLNCD